MLVVNRGGFVQFASDSTRALVASYLGPLRRDALPEQFVAWLDRALATPTAGPFLAEHQGRRLVVHLCLTQNAREIVATVEEHDGPPGNGLRRYGLTTRESEVLWWVAEGKTNREIAVILGCSARTVQTHLNSVYRKLGVETRTAAAALVLRTAPEHHSTA